DARTDGPSAPVWPPDAGTGCVWAAHRGVGNPDRARRPQDAPTGRAGAPGFPPASATPHVVAPGGPVISAELSHPARLRPSRDDHEPAHGDGPGCTPRHNRGDPEIVPVLVGSRAWLRHDGSVGEPRGAARCPSAPGTQPGWGTRFPP